MQNFNVSPEFDESDKPEPLYVEIWARQSHLNSLSTQEFQQTCPLATSHLLHQMRHLKNLKRNGCMWMVVNEVVSERFWKQIIWLSCRTSLVRNVIVQTHHHHNWEATNYARKPHETPKETSSQVLVFKASNWSSNRLEKTANRLS